MMVRVPGGTSASMPRRSLAAPVPPASCCAPERTAPAPAKEPDAGTPAKGLRQLGFRHRNETEPHPYAVEALRARKDRFDLRRFRRCKRPEGEAVPVLTSCQAPRP